MRLLLYAGELQNFADVEHEPLFIHGFIQVPLRRPHGTIVYQPAQLRLARDDEYGQALQRGSAGADRGRMDWRGRL